MGELSERIRASFENPNGNPWFPELTSELAARAWDRLRGDIGLTPDNYGTARVMSRSISAPRDIVASLGTWYSTNRNAPTTEIETLSGEYASEYHKAGVSFYSPNEILNTGVLTCIEDAFVILNQVPSLMRTVATLVRSLHVIKPEDTERDISFSEPEDPFSIFVSVPEERIVNDGLRVAEAIVHEAMHLQLTLIERTLLLISSSNGNYFSPWRGEYRNAQGLLHALYVFCVVNRFLEGLSSSGYYHSSYVYERRQEIVTEINGTLLFQGCSELTSVGRDLVRFLLP